MKLLRVGIVGARVRNNPEDKQLIREAILHLMKKDVTIHIVSGGCPKGADRFAEELAEEYQLGISIHYPDTSKFDKMTYSRVDYARACYARNTLIAEECDMLLATPAYDHKGPIGGTADTIKKVDALGKPVVIL